MMDRCIREGSSGQISLPDPKPRRMPPCPWTASTPTASTARWMAVESGRTGAGMWPAASARIARTIPAPAAAAGSQRGRDETCRPAHALPGSGDPPGSRCSPRDALGLAGRPPETARQRAGAGRLGSPHPRLERTPESIMRAILRRDAAVMRTPADRVAALRSGARVSEADRSLVSIGRLEVDAAAVAMPSAAVGASSGRPRQAVRTSRRSRAVPARRRRRSRGARSSGRRPGFDRAPDLVPIGRVA